MSAAKKTLSVGEARAKLHGLLDEASAFHGPILVTGKGSHAVLIAEEDWRAIEETLYLTLRAEDEGVYSEWHGHFR